jgi:N-methylhydantoinase A
MTAGSRIGVDTGGTFTDVVAVDEDRRDRDNEAVDSFGPGGGLPDRVNKVLRALGGGDAISAVSHGGGRDQQAARGQGREPGVRHDRGVRSRPRIARLSVPDGYGNSYFG